MIRSFHSVTWKNLEVAKISFENENNFELAIEDLESLRKECSKGFMAFFVFFPAWRVGDFYSLLGETNMFYNSSKKQNLVIWQIVHIKLNIFHTVSTLRFPHLDSPFYVLTRPFQEKIFSAYKNYYFFNPC